MKLISKYSSNFSYYPFKNLYYFSTCTLIKSFVKLIMLASRRNESLTPFKKSLQHINKTNIKMTNVINFFSIVFLLDVISFTSIFHIEYFLNFLIVWNNKAVHNLKLIKVCYLWNLIAIT